MTDQDWTPIVIRKTAKQIVDERGVNNPSVQNLLELVSRPKNTEVRQNLNKIEQAEDVSYVYMPREIVNKVKNYRQKNSVTQKDLAQKLNVKVSDIQLLESGKMIKSQALIKKINEKIRV